MKTKAKSTMNPVSKRMIDSPEVHGPNAQLMTSDGKRFYPVAADEWKRNSVFDFTDHDHVLNLGFVPMYHREGNLWDNSRMSTEKATLMVTAETPEQCERPGFKPLIETANGVVWARKARLGEYASLFVFMNREDCTDYVMYHNDLWYRRLLHRDGDPSAPLVWEGLFKAVRYKPEPHLTRGIFHKFPVLHHCGDVMPDGR